ncbi:MFS-type transporter SLC18B1 isoform X2 [Ixodes scapularis]
MADTVGEDCPLLPGLSTRHHSQQCSKEDRTQPAETASVWKKCRQIARVLPFAYVQFWMAALLSLTPAYFPPLAASKGLEAWQYGFVFSAFSFAVPPGALLAQKLIARGWSRTGYLAGLVFLIIFCFAFGALYWIPEGGMLLALSMSLILLKGVFATTYDVCTFGIITFAFTKAQGLFIAMLHCILQIGKVSGSSLGGILIDAWAFPAPFYAMGIAFALAIPPMVMLNPDKLGKEEAATATTPPRLPENEWSYYRLLRHPMFAINLLTAIILSLLANFDGPTLEPYLSQFNLTNAEIGTVFTANYVANCGGSLFAGVISSYKVITQHID